MQKTYNLTLLLFAVLFIVLHNVTPHTHEHGDSTLNIEQINSSTSDLLGGGLLIDLGGDHLEGFSKYQINYSDEVVTIGDNSQITPLFYWLEYSGFIVDDEQFFPLYRADFQEDIFLGACVSRGPPMVI